MVALLSRLSNPPSQHRARRATAFFAGMFWHFPKQFADGSSIVFATTLCNSRDAQADSQFDSVVVSGAVLCSGDRGCTPVARGDVLRAGRKPSLRGDGKTAPRQQRRIPRK